MINAMYIAIRHCHPNPNPNPNPNPTPKVAVILLPVPVTSYIPKAFFGSLLVLIAMDLMV